MVYLDNAATSYPKPEDVYAKMDWANRNLSVNPGRGSYKVAQQANDYIEATRKKLLELVRGEGSYSTVFTPSITIALNQIIQGLDPSQIRTIYISEYEHNAVARTLHLHKQRHPGVIIRKLPLDAELKIDLEHMNYLFSQNAPDAVIVNMMSNVTGYILPYHEIFDAAKRYDALTILDTAQGLGILELDVKKAVCDIAAFAGHKSLCGPIGIGGFIIRAGVTLKEFISGGNGRDSLNLDISFTNNSERYEFASQNMNAIYGLYSALNQLAPNEVYEHEKQLTEYLISQLKSIDEVQVYDYWGDEQVSVVSFVVENMDSNDVGMILDEDFNICVRTGYHCAPYIHDYLKDRAFNGTVRVSVGRYNTKEDIDCLISAIRKICS